MQLIIAVIVLLGLIFYLFGICGKNGPSSIGAMCYSVAVKVESIGEYTCPKCGEKTLYSLESGQPGNQDTFMMVHYELEECRRLVTQIPRLSVRLDESGFCKKCSSDIQKPQLKLIISFPKEQKEFRYAGITSSNLHQFKEFLSTTGVGNDPNTDGIKSTDCLEQISTILGPREI